MYVQCTYEFSPIRMGRPQGLKQSQQARNFIWRGEVCFLWWVRQTDWRPGPLGHEERFISLGLSLSLRLIVVCHCYRGDDGAIRIISARKATTHEMKANKQRWLPCAMSMIFQKLARIPIQRSWKNPSPSGSMRIRLVISRLFLKKLEFRIKP